MRYLIALVALGALLAMPCRAPAGDADEEPSEDELLQEHLDALRDYDRAETDEQAEKAQERFEEASKRELQLQRDRLDHAIER